MEIVKFPSSIELGIQYVVLAAAGIENTEADAIVVKDLDVDGTTTAGIGSNTQASLFIDFTKGSLTNATIKIYGSYLGSPTASDWYQEVVETDSTGVATLDAFSIVLTANAKIVYHFPIGSYRAFKVTIASSGTKTNSAIKLNLGLRNN